MIKGKIRIGKTEKTLQIRWNEYKKLARTQPDKFSKEIQRLNNHGLNLESCFKFEVLEICEFVSILHNREIDYIKEFNQVDNAIGYDLKLGWNTILGSYIDSDEKIYTSGFYESREYPDVTLQEFLKHVDLSDLDEFINKSIRVNFRKGPLNLLAKQLEISLESLQLGIKYVYGKPYRLIRREKIKEILRPYLNQGLEAKYIAPHIGIKSSRAAATLNRWCQDIYGLTFINTRVKFIDEVIRNYIIRGLTLDEIDRLILGYSKRGIQNRIKVKYAHLSQGARILNAARRSLAESILEHLCRSQASLSEVQDILGIKNVNAYTTKLWGMTFTQARHFFENNFLGFHEYDTFLLDI